MLYVYAILNNVSCFYDQIQNLIAPICCIETILKSLILSPWKRISRFGDKKVQLFILKV